MPFRTSLLLVGKVFAFGRRALSLLSRFHSVSRTFLRPVLVQKVITENLDLHRTRCATSANVAVFTTRKSFSVMKNGIFSITNQGSQLVME
jgi:hypothetical protein